MPRLNLYMLIFPFRDGLIQSVISHTHRIGFVDWLKSGYGGVLYLQAGEDCTDRRFSIRHERMCDEMSMFAKQSTKSNSLRGQGDLGKAMVTAAVTTECASQAILFCASLNLFQILNIMDLSNRAC